MTSADVDRRQVLDALRRHGWNSTSFQVLEPGFRYWTDDRVCVAYVDTGSAWVVAGAPIAPSTALTSSAQRFVEAAESAGRRACFFAVERRFVDQGHFDSVVIGEQPVWDPQSWPESVKSSKSLREQLRRARAKGVSVRRVGSDALRPGAELRTAVERLIERWSRSRPLAPMGFLVAVHPFEFPDERRYFVAEREGRVVAFLAMVPVYARAGWLLEDFLRDPTAPNGTMELLIDHALRAVADEGARYATLGLAPLSGEVEGWLGTVRDASSALYDFHGLRAFKEKLRPMRWDEVFLAFPSRRNSAVVVLDVLAAFSRVGLLRFGIETLLRVPAVIIQLLAVLIVPWALLLASLHPTRWFPSRTVQFAWVGFDLVLAAGLFRLAKRWGPRLSYALAVLITLDALLTGLEVVVYNLPRIRSHVDAIGAIFAVLAPSFGALLLWRAWWLRHA